MGHRWGVMEPELDGDGSADNVKVLQGWEAGARLGAESGTSSGKHGGGSTEGELPQEREALGELDCTKFPGVHDRQSAEVRGNGAEEKGYEVGELPVKGFLNRHPDTPSRTVLWPKVVQDTGKGDASGSDPDNVLAVPPSR